MGYIVLFTKWAKLELFLNLQYVIKYNICILQNKINPEDIPQVKFLLTSDVYLHFINIEYMLPKKIFLKYWEFNNRANHVMHLCENCIINVVV